MRRGLALAALVAGAVGAQERTAAPAPQLVLPGGHTGSVTAVAAVAGERGEWAASASLDGNIVVWDLAELIPLRRIAAGRGSIGSLLADPRGRVIATKHFDGRVRFWNPSTGALAGEPDALTQYDPLAFSPDGRTLYASFGGLSAFRGEPASLREPLWTVQPHAGGAYPRSVAASPDGRTLYVSPSDGGSIAILDAENGRALGEIGVPAKKIDSIELDRATARLAAATPAGVFVYDVSRPGPPLLKIAPPATASEVHFNSTGDRLALRGPEDVFVYEIPSGKLLRTIAVGYAQEHSTAVSGRDQLIAGSHSGVVSEWDLNSGQLVKRSGNRLAAIQSAHFASGGHLEVAGVAAVMLPDGSASATLGKVWDFASETDSSLVYEGHELAVTENQFVAGGARLYSSSFDGTRIWDAATLAPLAAIPHQALRTTMSEDGRTLVWQTMEPPSAPGIVLKIWDVAGNKLRASVRPDGESLTQWVAFHPGGEWMATTSMPGLALIEQPLFVNAIDLRSGTVRERFQVPVPHPVAASFLGFSPDGRDLILGLADGRIVFCDPARHTVRAVFKAHTRGVTAVAFAPDGTMISAAEDGAALIWDRSNGQPPQALRFASGYATALQFSPRGELLLAACQDGTFEIWDWRNAKLLLSVAVLDAQRWVAATPEGLFDGSDGAWETLHWRFANDAFDTAPVERFFNEFFYPGLAGAILSGQRPAPKNVLAETDRHAPAVQIEAAVRGESADVRLRVTEGAAGSGVRDVRLFRNGILVCAWRGPAAAELTARVALAAGENRLEAYAFNNANIRSATARVEAQGPAAAPARTAYLVAIGVNRYADASLNLEYARLDAEEFLKQVSARQEGMKQFAHVERTLAVDDDATRDRVAAALRDVSARAGPNDAILIFYAGHGIARDGHFYLLPHDARIGTKGAPEHGISDSDLEDLLQPAIAGHIALVLDTCQSGATLDSAEWRRGPLNSRGMAQLAYEKGIYLLAAAQSDGVAKERRELGHGLLTYALLMEGLDPAYADRSPQDGLVTLGEWLSYAGRRVPQLETPAGTPAVRGVTPAHAITGRVQQPRVYYRREWAAPPLVISAGQ
ncbi:MAG TPA: caspase family protein [Bryobacteraceae bacterium]